MFAPQSKAIFQLAIPQTRQECFPLLCTKVQYFEIVGEDLTSNIQALSDVMPPPPMGRATAAAAASTSARGDGADNGEEVEDAMHRSDL